MFRPLDDTHAVVAVYAGAKPIQIPHTCFHRVLPLAEKAPTADGRVHLSLPVRRLHHGVQPLLEDCARARVGRGSSTSGSNGFSLLIARRAIRRLGFRPSSLLTPRARLRTSAALGAVRCGSRGRRRVALLIESGEHRVRGYVGDDFLLAVVSQQRLRRRDLLRAVGFPIEVAKLVGDGVP